MPHATISRTIAAVALVSLSLLACGGGSDAPSATAGGAPAAPTHEQEEATHAAAGVRPGSYDDWCGEHQVPESLCTRCNATLIPAFQATGDWCPEHGLPESQCLLCNPGLEIRRPPRTEEPTP